MITSLLLGQNLVQMSCDPLMSPMSPDPFKTNLKTHLFNASSWSSYSGPVFVLCIVLTLKRPGGVESTPPSTFCATIPPRKFFWPRRSLTFYFQVSRILWHHFRENRAYRYDAAQPFIHARQTENGSKTWFCVQSQCKWSFLTLFIKIWLFSLSLAEINSF